MLGIGRPVIGSFANLANLNFGIAETSKSVSITERSIKRAGEYTVVCAVGLWVMPTETCLFPKALFKNVKL